MTENAQTEQSSNGSGTTLPPPEGVVAGVDSETVGTSPAATNGAKDTPQQQMTGKTVVMPSSALGRIKKEEREKGARQARLELATSYGFKSVDEFDAFLKGAKNNQGQTNGGAAQTNGKVNGNGHAADRAAVGDPGPAPDGLSSKAKFAWEREREKLNRELDSARRQAAHNDKKSRQLRKQLEDKDTEITLQRAAYLAGVKDVDYAIRMLERHVENKTEEELNGFDEIKFFDGLRGTHPYLFGEVVKPASTGTTGSTTAPPPKSGDARSAAATGGQVDAKTMDRRQFEELLRKRGLNPTQ